MSRQNEIQRIDRQIIEEIERYRVQMHDIISSAPQITVDINPNLKFEILENILLHSNDGYIYGDTESEVFEDLCGSISSKPDRYKRRKLIISKDIISFDKKFWLECMSSRQVFFYMEYNEEIFKSIFSGCGTPCLLQNPRSLVGDRLQTIKNNINKQINNVIITPYFENNKLLIFSSPQLLHTIFDLCLTHCRIDKGAHIPWKDLLWQKAHLEEPNGIDFEKYECWN